MVGRKIQEEETKDAKESPNKSPKTPKNPKRKYKLPKNPKKRTKKKHSEHSNKSTKQTKQTKQVKQCNSKTKKGPKCKNPVFRIKGENETKCKLHYLMNIHKQDDDPEPVEESAAPVVKGLIWIGSVNAARNKDLLEKHNIKSIVNASGIEPIPPVMKNYNDLGINYHTFTTYDDGIEKFFIDCPFNKYPDFTKKDFYKYIIQGTKILKDELKKRPVVKPILVHCHAGMNRSAAVICAYLILVGKMPYDKAVKLIEDANMTRGGLAALTNKHFRRALKELEDKKDVIEI